MTTLSPFRDSIKPFYFFPFRQMSTKQRHYFSQIEQIQCLAPFSLTSISCAKAPNTFPNCSSHNSISQRVCTASLVTFQARNAPKVALNKIKMIKNDKPSSLLQPQWQQKQSYQLFYDCNCIRKAGLILTGKARSLPLGWSPRGCTILGEPCP